MVKKIIKDIFIFRKAEPATKDDLQVAIDLADTLQANADICVGMAANMIGVNKRIIAFFVGPMVMTMINPIIVKKSKETTRWTKDVCHYLELVIQSGIRKLRLNILI